MATAAQNEALEERVASQRGKMRQNKAVPWLIRDDGTIFPNVPLIARKQNFRPYHGAIDAPIEERMKYLAGFGSRGRRQVVMSGPIEELPPFDIAKATKEELIEFAMEEFSEPLDPELGVNEMRAAVAKLAGVPLTPVAAAEGAAKGRQRKAAGEGAGLTK
jgi:hypothetical protein